MVAIRTRAPAVVLGVVSTAQFLVVANITLVTIALPAVQRDLGISGAEVHWTITGYTLTFAGTLLLSGRLTDRYGQRRVFLGGLGVFAVGSLGCGVAGHQVVLLMARGVQGLGAAAVAASALVVLVNAFPAGRERERALGVWSAAQAAGGAAGWLIGGVVSQLLGWRWVFLGSVVVAGLAAAPAFRVLPAGTRRASGLDIPGAVLATTGLLLVLLGLSGHAVALTVPAGCLALVGFVLVQRRSRHPMLPLGVLSNRTLTTGVLVLCLINGLTTPVLVLCARYLQTTAGLAPAVSGMLFVPFNLAVIAGSLLAARRVRTVTMAGAIGLIGTGAATLILLPAKGSFVIPLLAGFLLLGLGGGAAAVVATAKGSRGGPAGAASGLLNTATELGVALGSTGLLTVAAAGGPRLAMVIAATAATLAAVAVFLSAPGGT